MLKVFKYVALFSACVATISCGNDDEVSQNGEAQVDITNEDDLKIVSPTFETLDGQEVSNRLSIANSSKETGTPPAPTGEYSAPSISENTWGESNDKLRAKSGDEFTLGIDGSNLDGVEGVYLQVSGSSEYFDVPVEVNNTYGFREKINGRKGINGRVKKVASNIEVPIEIPASIGTGEFCVSYCLYNADLQISNIVTKCVQIQEFGGSTAFLGTWDFVNAKGNFAGEILDIQKGEPYTFFTESNSNACSQKEGNTINEFEMSYTSNGGYNEVIDASYSYFSEYDYDNYDYSDYTQTDSYSMPDPICSSYTTENNSESENGAWSYNSTTKTLTILYEDEDFIDLKLVQNGNRMSLVFDEGDEELGASAYIVYNFVKK